MILKLNLLYIKPQEKLKSDLLRRRFLLLRKEAISILSVMGKCILITDLTVRE